MLTLPVGLTPARALNKISNNTWSVGYLGVFNPMSDIGQANDNITVWFTVLCVTYGYYMWNVVNVIIVWHMVFNNNMIPQW